MAGGNASSFLRRFVIAPSYADMYTYMHIDAHRYVTCIYIYIDVLLFDMHLHVFTVMLYSGWSAQILCGPGSYACVLGHLAFLHGRGVRRPHLIFLHLAEPFGRLGVHHSRERFVNRNFGSLKPPERHVLLPAILALIETHSGLGG